MDDLGASTVSPDASSAPAPDTAATSAPPAADASSAPAAAQSTDAAASTETGATAAPSSLDEIFNNFQNARQEEAAPKAPEADADKAQAEPEPEEPKAGEEKPAEEQAPDAAAEEAPAEVDPLDDEPAIPTRDEIAEKFKRAPKAVRDFAADMAERAAGAEAKLAEIGGAEGAEVAKAIVPHLFEAAPGPEHANAMFEALVDANPPLVATMGEAFINAALDDERTGPAFADRLLEQKLGEGYTLARVEELVELDRQGLIDLDALREDLGTAREPTAREREFEAEIARLKAENKELTGGKEDATRREAERLATTVKDTVSRAVMAKVQPLAEKIGWVEKEGAGGPHAGLLAELGELAIAKMNAAIEKTTEWDAIQQLVKDGNAFRDGQPTRLMRLKLAAIERRSEAMFKGTARRLKPVIGLLAAQGTPQTQDPPPPSTGRSEGGDEPRTDAAADAQQQQRKAPQSLEEIHAEYARKQRDQRAPVGTLSR